MADSRAGETHLRVADEEVAEDAGDALDSAELSGHRGAGHISVDPVEQSKTSKKNAFAELMKSTSEKPVIKAATSKQHNGPVINYFAGRNGLGIYIATPETFTSKVVISYDEHYVCINDAFPKSSVHTLLLPRNREKSHQHPFEAFEDPDFLAATKAEALKLKRLVASELRRKYAQFSATEQARTQAMRADPPPETLPPGRDWESEVAVGIHAGPSMNHLHVHVLSVDRFSESLKHRKHYNSFATPFLVTLEEFPLSDSDMRRRPDRGGYLSQDMICWRCGQNFGNKFTQLKAHLAEEFEAWKRV